MINDEPSQAPPSVLYHYTSLEGLIGILTSGTLRATLITQLNDRLELRPGLSALTKVLEEHKAHRVLEELRDKDDDRVFVSCFCASPSMIPMWSTYAAAAGGGYAIGIRTEKLKDATVLGVADRRPALRRVSYDRSGAAASIDRLASAMVVEEESDDPQFAEGWSANEILDQAAALKSSPWSYEDEWRLVIAHHTFCGDDREQSLRCRPSPHGPVPYLEVKMWSPPTSEDDWTYGGAEKGSHVDDWLESVWIGPTDGQLERATGLEVLLRQAGAAPHRARMPYRSPDRGQGEESLIHFSPLAMR